MTRMVNPDLDGLEGKWDKDSSFSQDEQLKIPTDTRLYAVMVRPVPVPVMIHTALILRSLTVVLGLPSLWLQG